MMSSKKNYVNNKDLLSEIKIYKDSGVMSEKLGEMILEIANNFSSRGSFAGYTWRDDLVADGVLTCVKYLKNFDHTKSSNPFSYITQICYHAFLNYIKTQNKHSEIKASLYDRMLEGDWEIRT